MFSWFSTATLIDHSYGQDHAAETEANSASTETDAWRYWHRLSEERAHTKVNAAPLGPCSNWCRISLLGILFVGVVAAGVYTQLCAGKVWSSHCGPLLCRVIVDITCFRAQLRNLPLAIPDTHASMRHCLGFMKERGPLLLAVTQLLVLLFISTFSNG
ncbi:hypothetical protein BKA63DRAFT_236165 [Paraphoma chrysanthemicola]|nr:hypothetical protein BKA63DRAFT_236165 [Paraphoma chrysanthemicola]